MTFHIARRHALTLGASCLLGLTSAQAADLTPLKVIIPASAGSGQDTIIRAVSQSLSAALGGRTVVIENLAGAGGITGAAALTRAAPDGNTVAMISNNHVVNPSVYKKLPFDTVKDFTPIGLVGSTPFVMVVNPNKVAAKNAKELQALLKSKPKAFNYASSGNGTIIHLAGAMVVDALDAEVTHVPYRGMGNMVTDLLGGQVEMGVISVPVAQQHIKSGALRAIGITSRTRVATLPDVPTMAEQGFPAVDVAGWFAFIGPAKMAPDVTAKLHEAILKTFAMPEAKEAMAKQDNVVHPMSPADTGKFFRSEIDRYAQLVKKAEVKVE
jgi:tripartite-type tricarboxylate transporter receptor subunit TctC